METIIEHAVEDAPIVHRLLRAGKIAGAMLVLGTAVGAVSTAIGYRITGPSDAVAQIASSVKKNRADLDTLGNQYHEIKNEIDILKRVACVDPRISNRDKQLVGLDCETLLAGRRP